MSSQIYWISIVLLFNGAPIFDGIRESLLLKCILVEVCQLWSTKFMADTFKGYLPRDVGILRFFFYSFEIYIWYTSRVHNCIRIFHLATDLYCKVRCARETKSSFISLKVRRKLKTHELFQTKLKASEPFIPILYSINISFNKKVSPHTFLSDEQMTHIHTYILVCLFVAFVGFFFFTIPFKYIFLISSFSSFDWHFVKIKMQRKQ